MLSIEECRALIGDPMLTDQEIEVIRKDQYDMAEFALEKYIESKIKRH